MSCCFVLFCVVLCCAVLCLRTTVLTLRCSWSWAWCWRVNFSCCFWNSLISSCFWICCCFWMRSSSCCSCLSHSPGSEPGPSILRSVRRSKGDKGSTANGTSGLISTVAQKRQSKKRFVSPNCTLDNSSRTTRGGFVQSIRNLQSYRWQKQIKGKTKEERKTRFGKEKQIVLSHDPQKPAIIIVSINKHGITSVSAESTGSSCIWTFGTKCWSGYLEYLYKPCLPSW